MGELDFFPWNSSQKNLKNNKIFFHSLVMKHIFYRHHLFTDLFLLIIAQHKTHIIILTWWGYGNYVHHPSKCNKNCNIPVLKCSFVLTESHTWKGMFKVRSREDLRKVSLRVVQWLQKWLNWDWYPKSLMPDAQLYTSPSLALLLCLSVSPVANTKFLPPINKLLMISNLMQRSFKRNHTLETEQKSQLSEISQKYSCRVSLL